MVNIYSKHFSCAKILLSNELCADFLFVDYYLFFYIFGEVFCMLFEFRWMLYEFNVVILNDFANDIDIV